MIFKIKGVPGIPTRALVSYMLRNADFVITTFPMYADELNLNTFVNKEYHTSLKPLCRKLLTSLRYSEAGEHQIILSFKDEESETLANLITYGNGEVNGSNILKVAIGGKKWQ